MDKDYIYFEFLADVLNDKECLANGLIDIKPEMILNIEARDFYNIIMAVTSAGQEPNIINISNILLKEKKSLSRFLEISNFYVTSAYFPEICKEIQKRHKISRLKNLFNSLYEKIEKSEIDDPDFISLSVQNEILKINTAGESRVRSFKAAVPDCLQEIENFSKENYLHFNISSLDEMLGGVEPGGFIVVGASQSVGKSALASVFALNVAEQGGNVLIFSAEMKDTQYIKRMIAAKSRVDLHKIKTNSMQQHDYSCIYTAAEELENYPISIIDKSILNISDIESYIQLTKMQIGDKELKMVVIDHLQIIESPGKLANTRNDEVSIITRHLKRIAKKYNTVIVALSQLNRSENGGSPKMKNLRDSGMIAADADIVMLLSRPDYERKTDAGDWKDNNKLIIHIAKSRDGATGDIDLCFIKNKMIIKPFDN